MKLRLSRLFAPPEGPAAWRILLELREKPDLGDADTVAFLQFALGHCRRSHAQGMQDIWALFELGEKKNGYFVEFGAANGVDLSNTYLLSEGYGWHGVLAEPHPTFAAELRVNRPRDYVSDKAVWAQSGETLTFAMTRVPYLSVLVATNPPGLNRRKAMKHKKIAVQTISLNDLLAEADAPKEIDFVSVDVEGGEFPVMERFDFDRWRVRLFAIERNRAGDELDALMTAHGYERRFPELSGTDNWYRLVEA